MNTSTEYRKVFIGDQLVTVWEDPQQPFDLSPRFVQECVNRGDWEMVFNSLALTSANAGTA